jgi:transcription elongation GreA/GreB family factor
MFDLAQLAQHLEVGRLDKLEDAWLARLADRLDDLDFFVGVTEMLIGAGHRDRARFLLELLDEQLTDGQRWQLRLELLRRAGPSYLDPVLLHAAALATLREHYRGCPSLEGLIEKLGILRAVEDTPKTWGKVERLQNLMQFEEGAVVWMEGKGPGRVVEMNLELESCKVELQRHGAVRVGFAVAGKLLRTLPPSHIERRKLDDPDGLRALKEGSPSELLRVALESFDWQPTAGELRTTLAEIVSETEWSGWWNEARKNPQVVATGAGARQTYRWTASSDDAQDLVRHRFAQADALEKLAIFRNNADREAALVGEMIRTLSELAEESLTEHPELALSIWYALERADAKEELAWSPESVLQQSEDPANLLSTLSDRVIRERIYLVCLEARPDWPKVFRKAMAQEEDPRLLSLLATRLAERNPRGLSTVVSDILGHPRRHPAAFVWLAENCPSEGLLGDRNPLRVLRQILDALHQSEFSSYRGRILRTLEGQGAAVHLLANLTEDHALQAKKALVRAPLDERTRDGLIRFLHVRFPALDGDRKAPLYATAVAIENRRRELKLLLNQEIPANRKAIEEARALGDLRENFEYKAARQRHEYLNARVQKLQADLDRVRPLRSSPENITEARVGCSLDLRGPDGAHRQLTILGPWESDPDRGIVSYDSELGRQLLGKKPGDSVELEETTWQIGTIGRWS